MFYVKNILIIGPARKGSGDTMSLKEADTEVVQVAGGEAVAGHAGDKLFRSFVHEAVAVVYHVHQDVHHFVHFIYSSRFFLYIL